MWANARLFGLLNLALADGYIAMVDSKNHYNYWRPITAIRAGDTDGNPNTEADPTWTPLANTPNHPEYPSAHAFATGSVAEALRLFFGTKKLMDVSPFLIEKYKSKRSQYRTGGFEQWAKLAEK